MKQSPAPSMPSTSSTPSLNISADSISPEKSPAPSFQRHAPISQTQFATPSTVAQLSVSSNNQVTPQQPPAMNPFGLHPPMPPFMMPPVGAVTSQANGMPTPPVMSTAPPIPFPPPANFPPFPLPFLPPSALQSPMQAQLPVSTSSVAASQKTAKADI